jgi:ABC-type glycerol-3-phosphate transport system substrate-binding protein
VKALFGILIVGLVVASVGTFFYLPGKTGDLPALIWVVRPSETRTAQIDAFKKWLKENDFPDMEIHTDIINKGHQTEKNIVQGVSGVAGDILDCMTGEVYLYESVGLLEDLTETAVEMGFDVSKTYPAVRSLLQVDGRQYGFPRNVGMSFYWANVDAFERVGMSAPPDVWTVDEFEHIGKQFVQASNVPGEPQSVYLNRNISYGTRWQLARSMGLDFYNETMTESNFDHPIYYEVYEITYGWVNDLRIIPTKAEAEALTADTGVTRVEIHLFAEGNFGLMNAGRWGLMYFRQVGPYNLSISEYPYKDYRNTFISGGAEAVYAGSKHKDLAAYFMKYLSSEAFNRGIVENGDGLPPIPEYAETKEFLFPEKYPNEWGLHGRILEMAKEVAIPYSFSPFMLAKTMARLEQKAFDKLITDRSSIENALSALDEAMEAEMERKANESAKNFERYQKLLKTQAEIDRLRNRGELVPLELISNPFYKRYYVEQGWSLPEGNEG